MPAYYNEIDPYAAQWLRNLITEGLIPAGEVDERSIVDVRPADLAGYGQCHFFAGLGGWAHALRLADVPNDEPIWTGSCPCQPFSTVGQRRGFDDERHLWPEWFRLIRERRPAIVFGEQVASAAQWLGLVRSDLEGLGYAVGAMPLEAASAGADHLRDRIWFVADAACEREHRGKNSSRQNGRPSTQASHPAAWSLGSDGKRRRVDPAVRRLAHGVPARVAKLRALGNAIDPRPAVAFIRSALTT